MLKKDSKIKIDADRNRKLVEKLQGDNKMLEM